MNIGERFKSYRMMQGLTQEELAQRCELTKGFISQIENNLASPSINTFIDILEALGTNPSDFFEDRKIQIAFGKDDYFQHENEKLGYTLSWVVPNAQKNMMEPTIIELEANGSSEEIPPFEGEVFGLVLEGKIVLELGDKKFPVKAGESFYFEARFSHVLKNMSGKKSRVMWISTPPNF